MGVSRNTWTNWEGGKHSPSSDDIAKLSDVLRCDVGWLITGRDPVDFHREDPEDPSVGKIDVQDGLLMYPSLAEFLNDQEERDEMNPTSDEIRDMMKVTFRGGDRVDKRFWREYLKATRRAKRTKED